MYSKWMTLLALLAALGVASPDAAFAELELEAEVASESEMDSDHGADEHSGDDDPDHSDRGDASHGDSAHGEEHASSAPNPLETDPDLALWTGLVFLLLLAVLSQLAWGPIMEGLKAREDGITGKIADAERIHAEAKTMLAEHEAKLAGAAEEVRELLEEARRDADVTMAKAKEDAKAEFEAERQRAKRDIEQASDAAVRQLAEQTAGLAIDLAGRVVKQDISADRQTEIVREALGRFAKSDPSAN